MSKNRTRKNRVVVCLTDNEKTSIEQKMAILGLNNREAYARKMLLDGYIVQLDSEPTAQLVRLIKNATNNINQIAKRANESGSVYEGDVKDLLAQLNSIVPLVVQAHSGVVEIGSR